MNLVPVKITIYDPVDCTVKDQQELLHKRITRISNEAYTQGALFTQADLAILLGESTKTIMSADGILDRVDLSLRSLFADSSELFTDVAACSNTVKTSL